MRVMELNIGLNVAGTQNSQLQRNVRASQALKLINRIPAQYVMVQSRRELTTYDGPEGVETEDTLVCYVQYQGITSWAFTDAIDQIARELQQQCIATFEDDYAGGNGKLVGPGADQWTFDLAFFIRFNQPQMKAAA